MSSYQRLTQRPDSKEVENAEWLDDFFGNHNYGVRFPSDGKVFRADEYEWTEDKRRACYVPRHIEGQPRTVSESKAGKRFDHTEHDGGRKDVTVRVNSLDLHPKSPEEAHAKEQIEDKLLPKLGEMVDAAMERVVVLHHGTELRHAEHDVQLSQVRAYAEQVVKAFRESFPNEQWMRDKDFTIVEVHHDSYTTRVSTLEAYGK